MLNSFTTVKTKFIERKSSSTMWYLYRIMIFWGKKLGSVRTLFLLATYWNAESKTEFNNSLNSPKIVKLNIDTLIIPQGLSIHEKNPSSKISCYCPFNSFPVPGVCGNFKLYRQNCRQRGRVRLCEEGRGDEKEIFKYSNISGTQINHRDPRKTNPLLCM